jgi:uncharacterized protein YndB with AHSA1/START domain
VASKPDTEPDAGAEDFVLEMERVLPAAREIVFEAFVDPGQLAGWWGPEGFTIPRLDWRPRAGERYRIEMKPPDADAFHLVGDFREVEPPERLAFTFVWEPADPDDVETLAELFFDERGDSTAVAFRQGRFKTEARRELHRDGWSDTFDRLERLLSAS